VQRGLPFLLAIAAITTACGATAPAAPSGQSPNAVTPTPSGAATGSGAAEPSAGEIAKVLALIDAADLSNEDTVKALVAVEFTSAAAAAASQRLSQDAAGDTLWAATWVYVNAGTDPGPLMPLLGNADPTIQALAAAGLTALGRPEGLDGLVTSITSPDLLRGSHPPATVAQFAAVSLSRYAPDAVPSTPVGAPDERTALAAAWAEWLQRNRGSLAFDAEQRVWSVK
jgi:hypothetical protein